ncbi:unnamed protein product [Anisakis simplex]|uniref:Peptidase_M1_N domain-containing protein n=1 Tax=Anisakis simplex TaxID=6269 RepID=A0A0M3IZU9_ANISI|nr:unnamed protein product [Anisakis simplex]
MMPRAKMASTRLLLLQFMLILGITSGQNDFQPDAFDVDPTRYGNADYEFQSGHKLYNMDDSFLPGSVGERARRIPPIVEPIEYFIRIQPYFPNEVVPVTRENNMTFDGICTFVFKVMNATDKVTLHSFYLTYSNIKLLNDNGKELISNAHWSFNETLNHIVSIIQTGNNLRVGNKYMLQFKYNGKIHNYTETGLYYTAYLDKPNGTAHFMLATHMEPARARWVFPCLDEPAYKAYFHITLIYPKGLVALANTMERPAVPWPEEGCTITQFSSTMTSAVFSWEVIQFPPSLKMSTYLVAFAIGPYVNAHTVNEDGTLVSSC